MVILEAGGPSGHVVVSLVIQNAGQNEALFQAKAQDLRDVDGSNEDSPLEFTDP